MTSTNTNLSGYLPTNLLEFYKRLLTVLRYHEQYALEDIPFREEGQLTTAIDICHEYGKLVNTFNAIHCLTLRIAGAEEYNKQKENKQQEETSPGLEKSPSPLEQASAQFLLLVRDKGSQLSLYELLMKFYSTDIMKEHFAGKEWLLDASIAMSFRIYINSYRQEIVDFIAGNSTPKDF